MAKNENWKRPVQFISLNWLAQDEKGIVAESKEWWRFLIRGWGDWFRQSWHFILRPWIDHCSMQTYAAWLVNLQLWKLLWVAVIDLPIVRCLQHTHLLWKQMIKLTSFWSLFWGEPGGVSYRDIIWTAVDITSHPILLQRRLELLISLQFLFKCFSIASTMWWLFYTIWAKWEEISFKRFF